MIKNNSLNREEWDDRLFAFWQNEPLDEKEGEDIRGIGMYCCFLSYGGF